MSASPFPVSTWRRQYESDRTLIEIAADYARETNRAISPETIRKHLMKAGVVMRPNRSRKTDSWKYTASRRDLR